MEAHTDEFGPVDIVVISYPAGSPMTGEALPLLLDLIERKIIRVLDVLFVMEGEDGTFAGFQAEDLDETGIGDFKVVEGASSGLLGDDDAATAAEALGLAAEWRPRLLVSDLGLPGIDGYALLHAIRAKTAHRSLVAVAVTAFPRSDDRARALAARLRDATTAADID